MSAEQAPAQITEQTTLNQRAAQEDWSQDRVDAAQKALDAKYSAPALVPGSEQTLAQIDTATSQDLGEPNPFAAKIPETPSVTQASVEQSIINNPDIDQARAEAILAAHSIVDSKKE